MQKILDFLNGKRTYIIAGLAVIGGIAQKLGFLGYIPEWVWLIVGGVGLGTLRAAIKKVADSLPEVKP